MTVLKKISVINANKSFKYSILIGNNFIQTLENNFFKTLKGKKIFVIYDEFFYKLQLHKNLIEESDLDIALNDLEEKMDEKSFENFMRIKKESISKN